VTAQRLGGGLARDVPLGSLNDVANELLDIYPKPHDLTLFQGP